MNKKSSLVFFGSGPVAARSLQLLASDFSIEAVITKPTTEKEMKAAYPHAPLFTAQDKSDLDILIANNKFSSPVGVLIDFGIIISQKTINYFENGIINSHFSLLPELRGADPISFAILEGKKETGVSLMLLVKAMDEGPLIAQKIVKLAGNETTPILTATLIEISCSMLKECLDAYVSGQIAPSPQEKWQEDTGKSTSYTRKLTKKDGLIDWNKDAQQIEREIRAYQGWPKSQTKLGNIDVTVTQADVIEDTGAPGKIFIHEKQIAVYCNKDALLIKALVPAGKKPMDTKAFLAGYKVRLNL